MSAYFDALMRSSGMTFGDPKPAAAHILPGVVDPELDPGWAETAAEARTMPVPSTPKEAAAPIRLAPAVEPAAPSPTSDALLHRTEPESTPVRRPAASDPAGDARNPPPARSAESAERELGQTLVRAALRWVAAGAPTIAETAPADPAPVPAVREGTSRIAMASVPPGEGEVEAQPPTTTATSSAPNSSSPERHVTTPLAVRSARVVPAPPPPAARLRRNETVEVSIGTIHVQVDAPPPQTATRPAAPPAAAAPRAAGTAPRRSALARRALRRI